jgi:sporulation protein YlmC with PRC-barrel domain
MNTRSFIIAGIVLLSASGAAFSQQPVAGSTELAISVSELRSVATGWSAKRQVIGQTVYNDNSQAIGTVDDVIIAPDKSLSYAIIGAGGFLGVGKHDVAVPVSYFKLNAGKLVLAGATKEALKAMPPFEYAH